MNASAFTALTVLVGLFGGLIYLWGERSAFPWVRFCAVAVLVFAIGVAVATWPDHHVPQAGAETAGPGVPLVAPPSLSRGAPTGLGSGIGASTISAARLAAGLDQYGDVGSGSFSGSIVTLTGGEGRSPSPRPPSPSPPRTTPPPTPTPSPSESETPSPSPSPSESETPSPSPTESETPSPSPTESETPSPSPTESETPSPSPTETDPTPSPTDPTPSPTDPTPSPTELPAPPGPAPMASPAFRPF